MSFIGPELPSHHKNDETSQKGPRIPTHQSTLNIYDEDDDDDDGPKLAVTIGPSIPTPGPSTEKRQVGPTFPSYAPTYDPTTYDDGEDDDDEFGPKPLPAGMQHQQTDAVKEFIEREEKRRKLAEDAAKPKSLQRDEWMLVPPSSSSLLGNLDPTKLKARQFSRGSGPVNNKSDNSLWTETPAERQQRLADEVSGKKRRVTDAPVDEDTTGANKRRKQDEERIKKNVDEYTQKRRGPALVDQHAVTKKPEEKDLGIWDHTRDMGLGGRLMDDDKRNKMLKEAKGLGDRFGSGKSGGFFLSQVISLYNGDSARPSSASSPPTLGDIISPPWQSTTTSSDEEAAGEDEPQVHAVDLIPDYSTSSRRPPQLTFRDGSSELRIRAHPQTGCVALSGTYIVVGHDHHIKIFDLAKSELPLLKLDTKDIGPKDSKVSCMEFRPTASEADRGYLLWIGTKEGHIFELDIRTGIVTGIKQSAHHHCIVHIFRHSRSMVTLDEFGKALVFSPDVSNQEDISLALTIPRVVRTTEKQDFVKMLNGKLWTAIRTDHHSHLTLKSPTIRVFDLFNTANTEKSLLPTEHVGPVTSATILPSQPGMVYVAHEEGSISMWELNTEDGYRCVEVMKISASDILSLEGVSNRLWVGSRNGTISAYDVSQKPWLVTNSWNAHPGFPVMKLMINHYAITKVGKLCVASIGGDDQLRLWDGLLAWDWVDKELVKSEASFSSFRNLNVLVVSWNCGSARPDSLNGNPQNCNLLNDALHSVDSPPDIIVFGFQEVIDLESRRMMAYNVLLGGKKKTDDGLLEKVTGAYKRWKDRLVLAVQAAMPKDVSYCVTHNESLIGLFSCIFVKNKERPTFDDVSVTTIKRGMGGWYGNKGGIVARFVIGDSSMCFVNCHLAAGHNAIHHRNADIAGMLEQKAVFPPTKDHSMAYIGGNDGTMILDHEFVVLNGDMNYRIGGHHRDAIIAFIRAGDLASLLPHDQLLREIKFNLGHRLRGFSEGPLTFNPTYKYDPRSEEYDSSLKHRSPAWCDRILWRSRVADRVQQRHYKRYEANVSDHRPISAAFTVKVKKVDYEAREKSKVLLQARWLEQQEKLLVAAKEFYILSQALI